MTTTMSRRAFGGGVAGAVLMGTGMPGMAQAATPPTAGEIIGRIRAKLAADGVDWHPETIDTFKIGSPDTPVTGIATTFQATLDVLKQAAAARLNLIVSHERLFWDFIDEVGPLAQDSAARMAGTLENDPVLSAKRRFCEDHGLVVWRFHDHWHMHRPDPIFEGFTTCLEWQSYVKQDGPGGRDFAYVMPETTLAKVAGHVKARLDTNDVRVIGDPAATITRVAATAHNLREMHPAFLRADIVMVGETEEFDVFHYVRDAISLGLPRPKGMIVISHERLEEFGMKLAAPWLRPLAPELPIRFISAGNPYWVLPKA